MRRGFTLIELLVVIAIIGMLSAIFLPNYMSARERARDTQRKSDLNQIQKGFELYKQDQIPPAFPTTLPTSHQCWSSASNCTGNIYMNKFPTDPSPGKNYWYSFDNSALTYKLCACLENSADPDGAACAAPCGSCTSNNCYQVIQP